MQMNDKFNIAHYTRRKEGGVDPPNIVHLLTARQYGLKPTQKRQVKQFAELKASVSQLQETYCDLPPSARSTFLMSFNQDGSKVASTHGDHNIYISDVKTGKHIQKLEGHPRTPWCITFHPRCNNILASGCLSGEVRVWDLHGGSEKWKAEHDQVIASIAFHPFRQLIVVATGSHLYFWDWSQSKPAAYCSTGSQFERVRYVKFDSYGHRLITGISNYKNNSSSSGSFFRSCFTDPTRPEDPRTFEEYLADRRAILYGDFRARDALNSVPAALRNRNTSGSLERFGRSIAENNSSSTEQASLPPLSTEGSHTDSFLNPDSTGAIDSDEISEPEPAPNQDEIVERYRRDILSEYFEREESRERAFFSTRGEVVDEHFNRVEGGSNNDDRPLAGRNWQAILQVLRSQGSRRLLGENQESEENQESNLETEENQESNADSEADFFTSSEFWDNFYYIRSLCRELEDHLTPVFPQHSGSESRASSSTNSTHFGHFVNLEESDSLDPGFPNPYAPIIDLIGQIRTALRFSTFTISAVRERIGQIHSCFREIALRLNYWVRRTPMQIPINEESRNFFERIGSRITSQMDSLLDANARLVRTEAFRHHRSTQFERPLAVNSSLDAINLDNSVAASQGPTSNERSSDRRDSLSDAEGPSPFLFDSRQFSDDMIPGPSGVTPRPRILHPRRRRRRFRQRPISVILGSDYENILRESNLSFESLERNSGMNDEPSSSEESSDRSSAPSFSDIIPSNYSDLRIENVSDSDSDRPITPPLLMYSPTYASLLFNGNSQMALNDPLTQDHRIQMWDFTKFEIPAIDDATANVVVRRCMIHNDASVDISQDGQKLVALIPPINDRGGLLFGVFSLKPRGLGHIHCMYGFINNAISVSFSPLGEYVMIGSAYSRPNPSSAVVQIVKINRTETSYDPVFIRCFRNRNANEIRFQHASLNCVKWLPESGNGIAYATNRGCLCICTPMAGAVFEDSDEPVIMRGRRPI